MANPEHISEVLPRALATHRTCEKCGVEFEHEGVEVCCPVCTGKVEVAPPVLAPGLHFSVPEEVYHRRILGQVSKSGLDELHRSPAHYKAWVDGLLTEETPALVFGKAFHCAILEPERFAATYIVEPDFGDCRFKEAKANRDAWRREHAGKTLLTAADDEAIRGMRESVMRHPYAGRMIRDGRPEVTAVWKDPETGLSCRCRADYYVPALGMVLDLKSTDDASPDGFKRSVAKYRYFVQDALYRFGFDAIDKHIGHFILIAVEKTLPFAVGTYSLDAEAIGRGYTSARRGIDKLAECLRTNTWPAYTDRIQALDLPQWAS